MATRVYSISLPHASVRLVLLYQLQPRSLEGTNFILYIKPQIKRIYYLHVQYIRSYHQFICSSFSHIHINVLRFTPAKQCRAWHIALSNVGVLTSFLLVEERRWMPQELPQCSDDGNRAPKPDQKVIRQIKRQSTHTPCLDFTSLSQQMQQSAFFKVHCSTKRTFKSSA